MAGDFRFAIPALRLDSRFRGNDKTGARNFLPGVGWCSLRDGGFHVSLPALPFVAGEGAGIHPCRGFGGVPQIPSISPKSGGRGVDKALIR
jgi:hypothetical protein